MLNHIRPAIVMIALFTGVLGVGYPLAVTGVAQAAFSDQANGSLVRDKAGRRLGPGRPDVRRAGVSAPPAVGGGRRL